MASKTIIIKPENQGVLVRFWTKDSVASLGFDREPPTNRSPIARSKQLAAFKSAQVGDDVIAVNGSTGEILLIGRVSEGYRWDAGGSACGGWGKSFKTHKHLISVSWIWRSNEPETSLRQSAQQMIDQSGVKFGTGRQWTVHVQDRPLVSGTSEPAKTDSSVSENKKGSPAYWRFHHLLDGLRYLKSRRSPKTDKALMSWSKQRAQEGTGKDGSPTAVTTYRDSLRPRSIGGCSTEKLYQEVENWLGGDGSGLRTIVTAAHDIKAGDPREQQLDAVLRLTAPTPQGFQPTLLLEGVPGTGKTFRIAEIVETLQRDDAPIRGNGRGRFAITMHPATTYEDFVEGLRSKSKRGGRDQRNADWCNTGRYPGLASVKVINKPFASKQSSDIWFWKNPDHDDENANTGFALEDGFFLKVCAEAVHFPYELFVVLLDEFNRCNIPKVMGDLLTTIEPSKRAVWTGKAWDVSDCPCPSLPGSGRLFFVPDNIMVVATMNSSDRSVGSLDAALRRRFSFERVWPLGFGDAKDDKVASLEAALEKALGEGELGHRERKLLNDSVERWTELNKALYKTVGEDGMLGHSYLFDMQRSLCKLEGDRRWFRAEQPLEIVRYFWTQQILPQLCEILEANHAVELASDKDRKLHGALAQVAALLRHSSLTIKRPEQRGAMGGAELKWGKVRTNDAPVEPQDPARQDNPPAQDGDKE